MWARLRAKALLAFTVAMGAHVAVVPAEVVAAVEEAEAEAEAVVRPHPAHQAHLIRTRRVQTLRLHPPVD